MVTSGSGQAWVGHDVTLVDRDVDFLMFTVREVGRTLLQRAAAVGG